MMKKKPGKKGEKDLGIQYSMCGKNWQKLFKKSRYSVSIRKDMEKIKSTLEIYYQNARSISGRDELK